MSKPLPLPPCILLMAVAFCYSSTEPVSSASFRIESNENPGAGARQVNLDVTVYDRSDLPVSGLKRENFQVYESGVLQNVTDFSQEDIPTAVGLVIDTSGSMQQRVRRVSQAGSTLLTKSNPNDEVFLVTFEQEVSLLEDFTRDFNRIRDALNNLIASGRTALYDAIYLGIDKAGHSSPDKKALVVFSDGEDQASYYKLEDVTAKVRSSNVQLYTVLLDIATDRVNFVKRKERKKVLNSLLAISEATGGQIHFANTQEELNAAASHIADQLRTQYRLSYISTNTARDGKWRDVEVKLTNLHDSEVKRYKVRARRGYYAR